MKDPTEDEVRLANELANKAMGPFRALVSDAAARAICDAIADELLFTEAGRRKLRSASQPPKVDESTSLPVDVVPSGHLATDKAPHEKEGSLPKKAGSGS